jgi:integrase
LERENPSSLSRNLTREGWKALSDAAKALLAVASAALGEDSFSPDPKILEFKPAGRFTSSVASNSAGNGEAITVIECVREFLHAKARAGRSDRYLQALKVSLSNFVQGRARTPLGEVTFHEIEGWLNSNNWAARTKQGYLSDVRVMYNFALRRGLVGHNPAAAVELPVVEDRPAVIHSPQQVRDVLEFAREWDLDVCRAFAIRYFAGLRSSEVQRIDEKEIGEKFIEVTAAKSKTRRRRLVTIHPNLRLWLDLGGVLPLGDVNNRLRWFSAALLKAKGIEWEHNVTRHSFCSYHLARFGNAGKTALQAGHTEQMLFSNYRELVAPEVAREYWGIVPK